MRYSGFLHTFLSITVASSFFKSLPGPLMIQFWLMKTILQSGLPTAMLCCCLRQFGTGSAGLGNFDIEPAFDDVIRKGSKQAAGKPSFESLSNNQMKALQHYIREQANFGSSRASH